MTIKCDLLQLLLKVTHHLNPLLPALLIAPHSPWSSSDPAAQARLQRLAWSNLGAHKGTRPVSLTGVTALLPGSLGGVACACNRLRDGTPTLECCLHQCPAFCSVRRFLPPMEDLFSFSIYVLEWESPRDEI